MKMHNLLSVTLYAAGRSLLAGCGTASVSAQASPLPASELFSPETGSITFETSPRRKWDQPVIADLDGDGFPDMLVNDHGYGIKVFWNSGCKFEPGFDLLMGDTHGIAAGDLDGDGLIEIITARGGGSGSNARNAYIASVQPDRAFARRQALAEALPGMRGRTTKLFDADQDGDLDLVLTAIPLDFSDPAGANYVFENRNGQFELKTQLPATNRDGHKIHVTDWNDDNDPDILMYGEDRVFFLEGRGGIDFADVTSSMIESSVPVSNVTSAVSLDYDNDGDLDIYLTRAVLPKSGDVFYDAETGTLAFYASRTEFTLGDQQIGEHFHLENYQAPWPHESVFTGEAALEYVFDGETHSGQSMNIVTSDALGWPDKVEDFGLYVGYVGNGNWRVSGKVTSPVSGVIHGVKGYKPAEHPAGPKAVFLENTGSGFAVKEVGLPDGENLTGAAAGDIDNDGDVDLIAITRGSMASPAEQRVFLNTGGRRFETMTGHGLTSADLGALGLGAELFDFDCDGDLDAVFGNERGRWHLFRNTGALDTGRSFAVRVGRSPRDGADPIGAKVTMTACDRSQVRHVGFSSSPYSQSADPQLHFGLGQCRDQVTVSVAWPNGEQVTETVSAPEKGAELGAFRRRP